MQQFLYILHKNPTGPEPPGPSHPESQRQGDCGGWGGPRRGHEACATFPAARSVGSFPDRRRDLPPRDFIVSQTLMSKLTRFLRTLGRHSVLMSVPWVSGPVLLREAPDISTGLTSRGFAPLGHGPSTERAALPGIHVRRLAPRSSHSYHQLCPLPG